MTRIIYLFIFTFFSSFYLLDAKGNSFNEENLLSLLKVTLETYADYPIVVKAEETRTRDIIIRVFHRPEDHENLYGVSGIKLRHLRNVINRYARFKGRNVKVSQYRNILVFLKEDFEITEKTPKEEGPVPEELLASWLNFFFGANNYQTMQNVLFSSVHIHRSYTVYYRPQDAGTLLGQTSAMFSSLKDSLVFLTREYAYRLEDEGELLFSFIEDKEVKE